MQQIEGLTYYFELMYRVPRTLFSSPYVFIQKQCRNKTKFVVARIDRPCVGVDAVAQLVSFIEMRKAREKKRNQRMIKHIPKSKTHIIECGRWFNYSFATSPFE